jgi:hypothetical protein
MISVGGAAVISALFALRPRDGDQILDQVWTLAKVTHIFACVDDDITCGCCFLVEGALMMALLFEIKDSVPPPQYAPFGSLPSC